MKPRRALGPATFISLVVAMLLMVTSHAFGQSSPYERSFRQPKNVVEKTLKQLQASMSGHLPVLDGFATVTEHPLDHYQRGYFQSVAEVISSSSGGCVVRVTAKVTAWYNDSVPSHSGYRLLTSNGRLENDLLDQLADQLRDRSPGAETSSDKPATGKSVRTEPAPDEIISAPMPQPAGAGTFSSTMRPEISGKDLAASKPEPNHSPGPPANGLQAEAASLEEVLRNQAHPKNIVAVRKSGTPVVSAPSLTAKTLFMASMHDEFEMLDFNRDWVHVRISGPSRGWIWRDSLEMPDKIPDNPQVTMGPPPAADLFQVSREETAPFPGDWQPLRGKTVKIVSVQKIKESAKDGGAQAKLEFAKFLLDKNYAELATKSKDLSGIVLIFDSADGGMVAATLAVIERWKAGALTDSALWRQCFFDPPETFAVSSGTGTR